MTGEKPNTVPLTVCMNSKASDHQQEQDESMDVLHVLHLRLSTRYDKLIVTPPT